MATEGVRFTNAHSAAATSTPSRYAMLTGEYAWRREGTGIADGDAGMIIRPERYTLADMFRDAGYATGVVGKWHLGLGDEKGTQDWNQRLSPNPADIGFDYSYIMAATGDRVPCVFVENGAVVNLDPEKAAAEYRESVISPYRGKLPESVIRNMEEQLSGSCTVEIAAFNEFSEFMSVISRIFRGNLRGKRILIYWLCILRMVITRVSSMAFLVLDI